MPSKLRKRLNADDALRAAERAYQADPTPENLTRYWKAQLRAGILPTPNHGDQAGKFEFDDNGRMIWAIPRQLYVILWRSWPARKKETPYWVTEHYVDERGETTYRIVGPRDIWYRKEAYDTTRQALSEALERPPYPKKNPKKNPDDDLRRLERKADETQDKEDILRYWLASMRAGKLPKGTWVQGIAEVWTLYPRDVADPFAPLPPRIIRWRDNFHVILDTGGLAIEDRRGYPHRTRKESLETVKRLLPRLYDS